jgi:hypothetical protein
MPLFEAGCARRRHEGDSPSTPCRSSSTGSKGGCEGLVGQKYWGWGYDTVYMMYDHVVNGTPYDSWTNSGMDIVTINNVDAMATAWENSDFTQPLPAAYPPADGTFTIAWIPKSLNNPVFELGRDGCFAAAAEMTAAGPYPVECLYLGSVASDMAEQARVIADAVAQGVDAIGVSCNSDAGCVEPINAAIAAGIPVMTWATPTRLTRSASPTWASATTKAAAPPASCSSARWAKKARLRCDGACPARRTGRAHPRLPGLRGRLPRHRNRDDRGLQRRHQPGRQVVEETMQSYPELDGWFFVGCGRSSR